MNIQAIKNTGKLFALIGAFIGYIVGAELLVLDVSLYFLVLFIPIVYGLIKLTYEIEKEALEKSKGEKK